MESSDNRNLIRAFVFFSSRWLVESSSTIEPDSVFYPLTPNAKLSFPRDKIEYKDVSRRSRICRWATWNSLEPKYLNASEKYSRDTISRNTTSSETHWRPRPDEERVNIRGLFLLALFVASNSSTRKRPCGRNLNYPQEGIVTSLLRTDVHTTSEQSLLRRTRDSIWNIPDLMMMMPLRSFLSSRSCCRMLGDGCNIQTDIKLLCSVGM